jgi:hypothetical protein
MFMYVHSQPTAADLNNLFPGQGEALAFAKAEEALQSHLIMGFKEALDLGMPQMEALSRVLSWVACEIARVNSSEA